MKKNYSKNLMKSITTGALALFLVLSPTLAFAHESGDNDKDHRDAKIEAKAKKDGSCFRAFGHLVAPGWIKVKGNGSLKLGDNCRLPFGILKKMHHDENNGGGNGTEDKTAPIISNINSLTSSTAAIVSFTTDEKASAKIFYGSTAGIDVNNSATLSLSDSNLAKLHAVRIVNLAVNTKYYAIVQVKDASGNISSSAEFNFTTKAVADNTAPVITSVSTSAANSSITVNWTTNEPTDSKVFYGTVTPLNISASSTANVQSAVMATSHSLTIPSLSANTQYYIVIQSKDTSANVSSSTELGVKTAI
jgi:hypothetical protein